MARSLAQPARMVWALCLAIGTCTHIAALIYGWNDRVPFASLIFWNSLTVLDPLAAALLFLRPRIGVVLTLAIMVSDVGHNIWAIAAFEAMVWPVAAQALFLIFVLATARLIWREAPGQRA
jgi:hypothetical protein